MRNKKIIFSYNKKKNCRSRWIFQANENVHHKVAVW